MTASQKTPKTSSPSNTPTTSKDALTPPWIEPQLQVNVEDLLTSIRETHMAIDNLKSKKEQLLARLLKAYDEGMLEEYKDSTDPKKINFTGVTFTRSSGKKRRIWDDEVKRQLQDSESRAKMMGLYKEVEGQPYWTTRLEVL